MNITYLSKMMIHPLVLVACGLLFCAHSTAVAGSITTVIQDAAKGSSFTGTSNIDTSAYSCNADPDSNSPAGQSNIKHRSGYWAIPESDEAQKCLVRLRDIRNEWLNKKIKIVDVRSQQAYQQLHIPNSLNISEYAIRTKTFLKSDRFLLVNDGHTYESLIQTCHRLRKVGFNRVSVLVGGVNLWNERGEPVVTNPDVSHYASDVITPRGLFLAHIEGVWMFLTNQDIESVKRIVRSENVLPFDVKSAALKTRLQILQKNSGIRVPVNIVIITGDGKRLESSRSTAGLHQSNPILFLQDGLDGYKRYLVNHKLQLAKSSMGPVKHKGCGG